MPPQNINIGNEPEGRIAAWWRSFLWFRMVAIFIGALGVAGIAIVLFLTFGAKPSPSPEPAPQHTPNANTQPADGKQAQEPARSADTQSGSPPAANPKNGKSVTSSGGGTSASSGGGQSSGSSGSGGVTCLSGTHIAGASDGAGGCWPGPDNTGVPAGVVLTAYAGPCVITTAGTVIDAKTVNCDLDIQAANVTIKNSKVNGIVFLDNDLPGSSLWSMLVQDTEVDAGTQQRAAISVGNMTVLRANLHGGETAAQCEENSSFCSITDSWLHGQYIPDDQPWHLGGFLSDGGVNMTLRHNTVVCDHAVNSVNEGCTGDLNFIPNFAAISGALVEHNLLGANIGASYCTYGGEKFSSPTPHSNHLVYKDNIFQRGSNNQCAAFGPVTNFDINQPGNEWTNNRWADGGIVDPAN
jgi:hypothetical protein